MFSQPVKSFIDVWPKDSFNVVLKLLPMEKLVIWFCDAPQTMFSLLVQSQKVYHHFWIRTEDFSGWNSRETKLCGMSLLFMQWSLTIGPMWFVAVWLHQGLYLPSSCPSLKPARGHLSWLLEGAGFQDKIPPPHSWHSHGMAINYAQRVHFQFKCVLIPEEQLMASSYWCEESLPLQWLWINEITVMEVGPAMNR